MIKSPLRYPGGKTRAIKQIANVIPESFNEYREPFVGGGSVFAYIKQSFPMCKIWVNDINKDLYLFWLYAQKDVQELCNKIANIKLTAKDGEKLFYELKNQNVNTLSDIERAVRFFVLNRISFSGTVDSSGYSKLSFSERFTDSSIQRVVEFSTLLDNIRITNLDYSELLVDGDKNVFVFLDPPYINATKSKLYGKNGKHHIGFDHKRFANEIKQCKHKWLITYDMSNETLNNFSSANITPYSLQYGMNNYKQGFAKPGQEIFISNY